MRLLLPLRKPMLRLLLPLRQPLLLPLSSYRCSEQVHILSILIQMQSRGLARYNTRLFAPPRMQNIEPLVQPPQNYYGYNNYCLNLAFNSLNHQPFSQITLELIIYVSILYFTPE